MDATETVIMETAEDLTHCSICNEFFSEPRMLPCIHNFCLRCLQQTASSMKMGPGDTMACHCCGKEFTIPPGGVTGLQRSLFIENLVKEMKLTEDRGTQCKAYLARGKEKVICVNQATTYCIECRQKFCKTCSEHHRRQKVSKKHHITMLELNHNQQVSSANYCSLHNHHPLSVYCFECKLIICDECCKQTHSIHTCKPIGEVIENSKMQITADLEVLASLSKAGSTKKEQLDTIKTECLKGFVDVEAEIIERSRKLKELVDAHVGCLLSQLVLMKTKRMFEIDSRIDEIKTCLELTETFEKSCADMSLKTSSLQTCSEATVLNKKAIQIQKLFDASHVKGLHLVSVTLDTSLVEEQLLQMRNIVGEIREDLKSVAMDTDTLSTNPVARDDDMLTTNIVSAVSPTTLAPDQTTSEVIEEEMKPARINTAFDPSHFRHSTNLGLDANVCGIAKLSGCICVLVRNPNAIHVFLDQHTFRSKSQIQIHDIKKPHDIASAEKQNCLYVTDSEIHCVWKVTSDHTITKWLSDISDPYTLFITPDSRLVMSRQGKPSRIEIYKQDASLECFIQLPINIEEPLHAVENSDRNFVVSHKWRERGARETIWSISMVNDCGEILHRLCAKDSIQCLKEPQYLSVDSTDQVLVADFGNGRVVLLNSDLSWNQPLETEANMFPKKLYLDGEKKQLFIGLYLKKGVHVYAF